MKRNIAFIFAALGWFAVIAQYYLVIENRTISVSEATIRFFSFFTILTNILVALYFSIIFISGNKSVSLINAPGTLTFITIYITVVGLVYQVALRHLWHPQGMQRLVDELLHSVIPIFVVLFWYLYEAKKSLKFRQTIKWLTYPLIYFIYILVRGNQSGFYSYPFIDVSVLGFPAVIQNAFFLLLFFLGLSSAFILIGKQLDKK
ncbi:Pr6Pr family membrane protein [Elizabethkingia anophelis]|uniref:Pr6Pr family membrane protein n=1 Tax=Elizabethkingia anophelis TaxID=1117645 RepID=UPI00162A28FE|nr:Pr6Pr family membrane protein [Elizabethkingia anophelis]MCT3691361.1 Pr6Pr family membrane protein [Elizabethkingia anophelis]MCT3822716.1 Pr6Pr family membrane protein [Elizabethkingia anophelis]MCT3930034.1 Pr6Pr family membrane protein [Elizabethkingia anophelis]MCT4076193.1 Pr6Pr family membrane protein [Elizabethkingia anophelis]MCT4079861.1 Pr6Pr family membrane protein [Elizabethkingia anophelis]